jgi:thiol-disulfide isomerase/thioredoxin
MRRVGTLLAMALAGVLAVIAPAGCTGTRAPTRTETPVQVIAVADRVAAPALRGELVGGGTYDLATARGQVVVVNFWAAWCDPCVAEADDLERTYQETKARGVAFLGVNTRDQRDDATRFLVGRTTYPSLFDPTGKLALGFSVPLTSIPSTVILDRQGRVAAVAHGAVLHTDLAPAVESLAAEPVP